MLLSLLQDQPLFLLSVVIGLGSVIGSLRLGAMAGVMFTGILFGHLGYTVAPDYQTMGFALFMYAVGLQAGPRVFSVLRQDGVRLVAIAVVTCGAGAGTAAAMSYLLGFGPGVPAGLMAGSLTSTPALVAAREAVSAGLVTLPAGTTCDQVQANMSAAYAITYIFGMSGLIFLIRLIPRVFKVDLAAAAAALEENEESSGDQQGLIVRAVRLEEPEHEGRTLDELYHAAGATLASVQKLRRQGEFLPITGQTRLHLGDCLTLIGPPERWSRGDFRPLGTQIHDDPSLLDVPLEGATIVVTRAGATGLRLKDLHLVRDYGCFVSRRVRLGIEIPLHEPLARGDVLSLSGPSSSLERLAELLGHLERDTPETDLASLVIGLALGIILGSLSVKVGRTPVGLGLAGGLLVSGLLVGYARSLHPTFGRMPAGALWLFKELGMLAFIACVGLSAGQGIVEMLASSGPALLLAGVVTTAAPVLVGFLFGLRILGMNSALLLGAVAGSMTSTPALSVVSQAARSGVPALGYTGAYSVAVVMLTVAGSLIVRMS